jgi:acetyl esterase/lipase
MRPRVALAIAALTTVLAIFIIAPSPSETLYPLSVGAPEVSAWLFLVATAALLLALRDVKRSLAARIAAMLAVATITISSVPFVRLRGVAGLVEMELQATFGAQYLEHIPQTQRAMLRPAPLVVRDLFRGLGSPAASVRITRDVTVASVNGVTLTTDVYQPTTAGTHPVVVQVYGGAWQRGKPADFSAFAERIAALGFVVFAIDYRHAPQFQFPAQVDDVRRALAWIGTNAASWQADASRMVLIGRSAGAHLAMLAAYATEAPQIRGVVSLYGPVDLTEGYRLPPSPDPLDVRAVERAFLGGTPAQMPERYRAASPLLLVVRALPPSLLIYGGRDHIVEARFGAALASKLRATGSPVVHVQLPQSEHAFDNIANGPAGQLAQYAIERFIVGATTSRASNAP